MSNTFQFGHCEGCIQYKTEKRILLKSIEGYKRVIDKIINSDSYPLSDDLTVINTAESVLPMHRHLYRKNHAVKEDRR